MILREDLTAIRAGLSVARYLAPRYYPRGRRSNGFVRWRTLRLDGDDEPVAFSLDCDREEFGA